MNQNHKSESIYCIACGVFRTDLDSLVSTWTDPPIIEYLEEGLHSEPDTLRKELQNSINKVPESIKHIVLLYGKCGKGIDGLHSGTHTLVIPRVHDCISLFLGWAAEYRKQFSHVPGTFYTSAGWYEEQVQPREKKPMGFPRQYVDNVDDEILIVPPDRKVVYDYASGGIISVPPDQTLSTFRTKTIHLKSTETHATGKIIRKHTFGLGIDAGGTYTDAVFYNLHLGTVLSRAKALTTKWQYSEGIMNAVNHLPADDLSKVDLVSLSTTLVTNAIVESNTYPVGLLIMPLGNVKTIDIEHTPTAMIKGRMTIDGTISEEVDPEEIRKVSASMIENHAVKGFAVSGYGGSVNPDLELQVKKILRDSTGMDVCCGHELSGTLNFYIRARTAVLNAGAIPVMEEFLQEMKIALQKVGIKAPVAIVRGDGSIMSESYAEEFPIQTALSGPAASMAGASHLSNIKNALIADVGGTTTDMGFLDNGAVTVCDDGAFIGNWKTHVRAVDMHTVGLGGDSEIIFSQLKWIIGPRRITPFCWLDSHHTLMDSISNATAVADQWKESTIPLQWLYVTGKNPDFPLSNQEKKILEALGQKPLMLSELSDVVGAGIWTLLRTERLEKSYCIQRAGLTPTDLYHIDGRMKLWDSPQLTKYFSLISKSREILPKNLMVELNDKITDEMAQALLSRIFPESDEGEVFKNTLLNEGNRWLSLHMNLSVPVIGLGAPASIMLADPVKKLGGKLYTPSDCDVANAIGAITSKIAITSLASINPTGQGKYRIQGLKHELEDFPSLEEAEEICIQSLSKHIKEKARRAGTSESNINIEVSNRMAEAAGGESLFLERLLTASITGIPDLI